MAGVTMQFGAQVPGYHTRRTYPGYVGNYIYEPSIGGWHGHYHKRQRPTKIPRYQNKNRNTVPPESPREEEPSHGQQSSESGYDTTGDPQTPRETKASKASDSNRNDAEPGTILPETSSSGDQHADETEANVSISDSADNIALHKLLRDLNRCDASIQRYKNSLKQNCTEGESQIKQIFSRLYQHLQTREHDLLQELATIQQTAGSILERRKATLECLREAAANYTQLGEGGIQEIRAQIKQFVTDRKVDEEIGTIERFEGDVDDILPHIMGFGKINNVRHLYTEWEEFPTQLIVRNKNKVTFLSSNNSEKVSVERNDKADVASLPTTSQSSSSARTSTPTSEKKKTKRGEGKGVVSSKTTRESLTLPISTMNTSRPHQPSHFSRFGKNHRRDTEEKTRGEVRRDKYSPEELKAIQDRVKSSLESQGVFLYDPVTGAGPPSRTVKQGSGVSGRASVESEARKSEGEDTERGRRKRETSGEDQAVRKKKTPTQLRRERKKRQKEREKRQRELEKTGSEESDAQVITPPPPLESAPEESSSLSSCSLNLSSIPSLASLAAKVALESKQLQQTSQNSSSSIPQ